MSHLGILTAWNYAWSVLTACFVIGIAIYLLDRKFGCHVYRFAYDFFHKNPMSKEVERGFLYDQSSNRGVTVAVFLSTIYSLYMVWELGFGMDFIAELIVWLFMPFALVGGFWTGRVVYKALLRRSAYFDRADELGQRLESIQLTEVADGIRKKGSSLFSRVRSGTLAQPVKPTPAPEPTPVVEEQPKVNFREMLDKYKGGRK